MRLHGLCVQSSSCAGLNAVLIWLSSEKGSWSHAALQLHEEGIM